MRNVFAWASAALFLVSLGYFLFTYTVTFAEPATGPVRTADLAWNAGLFTLFALHHSAFARTPLRRAVARSVPAGLERSFYVAVASILLILVCRWWRPVPGVAWAVEGPAAWMLRAGQLAGVWLTIRSAAIIDVRELAGLTRSRPAATGFSTRGPYGWVRHPIYAGWFLLVFCVPLMTMTRLEFAVVSAMYILVAIPLEERTLRATAGAPYEAYARAVRWKLIPKLY